MDCTGLNREDRVMEKEWLKALFKLKETLVRCPYCKDETFFNLKQSKCDCINCDKEISRSKFVPYLALKNKCIPLQKGTVIYRDEIDDGIDYTIESVEEKVCEVVENKKQKGVWGLKNLSNFTWYRHTPAGKE